MKKRFFTLILLLAVLMLFTACKSIQDVVKSKSPDLNKAFTSNVTITYNDNEVKAVVTRYGTGIWDMEIVSPDSLAGMTINYSPNGVNVMLGEMSFDVPLENINSGSVFNAVFNVIDNAAAMPEMDFSQTAEGPTFFGTSSVGSYALTFDPNTNMLTNVSIPDLDINVKVDDVRELSSNIHDVTETTTTETTTAVS